MGKINRGILGGFSGKVANIIGGSWKGIAYMRSQPVSVSNPNTAGQQTQRSKFSGVVALATLFLTNLVKPLNDRFAVKQSGYNLFVSRNIDAFDSSGSFLPGTGLEIARGNLLEVDSLSISGTGGSDIVDVTWDDNSGGSPVRATDELFIVVYNETQDVWGGDASGADRSDTTVNGSMPSPVDTGDVLHVYAAFRTADGTEVSNTSSATVTV
jgi:hypothetical protein